MIPLSRQSDFERLRTYEQVSRVWFDAVVSVRYALKGESFPGASRAVVTDSGIEIQLKPGQGVEAEYKSFVSALAFIRLGMVENKSDHDVMLQKLRMDCYKYGLTL